MDPIQYIQQELMQGENREYVKLFLLALLIALLLIWAEDKPDESKDFPLEPKGKDDPSVWPNYPPDPFPAVGVNAPEPHPSPQSTLSDPTEQFYAKEEELNLEHALLEKERLEAQKSKESADHAQKMASIKMEQARAKQLHADMKSKFGI